MNSFPVALIPSSNAGFSSSLPCPATDFKHLKNMPGHENSAVMGYVKPFLSRWPSALTMASGIDRKERTPRFATARIGLRKVSNFLSGDSPFLSYAPPIENPRLSAPT